MRRIAAALALCCGWLFAQTQPLLLQNAAQMSGMRSQGELVGRSLWSSSTQPWSKRF